MPIKDLFQECLKSDEKVLCHYIHHLLEERKISLDDDDSMLDFNQADMAKVSEMIEKNVLGICNVGIYSLKMDDGQFMFIFAGSRQEAIGFYSRTHGGQPLNCFEYSLHFELMRGNEVVSFRDMRKDYETFPAVAGYFERRVYHF